MNKVLEIKNLYQSYDGKTDILKDISLDVYEKEFIAIIGASGSGKSTLLKSINLLLRPRSGEVIFQNKNLMTLEKKELNRSRSEIGFIFQDYNLIEELTVLENVLLGRVFKDSFFKILFKRYSKEEIERAYSILEMVNLKEKALVYARDLSGGQKQRVAIAKSLIMMPKIVLADEPVSSLDAKAANNVMEHFLKVNKEYSIPILINLHDINLALKYADRIVALKNGKIVLDKKTGEVELDDLQFVY